MGGHQALSRIVVVGAAGQVGRELVASLAPLGSVVGLTRADADLESPDSLRDVIERLAPDIVINAAAHTAVDRAESEPDKARRINTESVRAMAEACEKRHAAFVHFSTDYVYDGSGSDPIAETRSLAPLSVYGKTKADGDVAALASCRRTLVFRTSWVYAAHGNNFLRTMLRLGGDREQLRVVNDQFGAPTSARRIASGVSECLGPMSEARPEDPRWGVYHLVAGGTTTWHGFASYLLDTAKSMGMPLRVQEVAGIPSSEYPTPAIRPKNSRLDTAKIRRTFGVNLPDWKVDVEPTLRELKDQQ